MSPRLLDLSPDLVRLRDEGYDVRISAGYLVVDRVPYVTASKEIKFGILISTLILSGDVTAKPEDHVVHFAGEYPCNKDGVPIEQIRHQTGDYPLAEGLVAQHKFSNKPADGYTDYYHKMTTYMAIIGNPARAIDPNATACHFSVVEVEDQETPFRYLDTATSRAGTTAICGKLELGCVGIVGLGGSGSYVLDLVAKTPVKEIRLFDADVFLQHNAFRSPGAASLDCLREKPQKVRYFQKVYSEMHRNIVAIDQFIDASNLHLVEGMDFVFLCLDRGTARAPIVEKLEQMGTPFIDLGMGVELVEDRLHGVLRVTASTPERRDHFRKRVSLADDGGGDEYSSNIQIAELNSMSAALAVIKWKKLFGFYGDLENEYDCNYTIDGNVLINSDQA